MAETINTSGAQPGDVLIALTFPQGGGGRRASLTIKEQISGETLIDIDLSPDEFLSFMSNCGTYVNGARITRNPQRLGKRQQYVHTDIRFNVTAHPEQVRAEYLADGWEVVYIDNTNFGHRVRAYRWVDADTDPEA